MAFKDFRINILVRIIFLVATSLGLSMVIFGTNWVFTPIILALVLSALVFELIRYSLRTNRELTQFLAEIRQGSYSGKFSSGSRGQSFSQLSEIFNQVITDFNKVQIEKEAQHQYLEAVNENIGIGIISFETDSGHIHLFNPAAKQLLARPHLQRIQDLKKINQELFETIFNLESNKRQVVKMVVDERVLNLMIIAKEFSITDKSYKIILLNDINAEIEATEIEAWQKLISVLTHEIMNSVTPMVSLSRAMITILSDDEEQRSREEVSNEEFHDVYSSLQMIEARGNSLMQFINAYKSFYKTPQLQFSETRVTAMISNVRKLFESELKKQDTGLVVTGIDDNLKIWCDGDWIEQVLINLVRNSADAVKDQKNGSIRISAGHDIQRRVFIRVADNGPGIKHEDLDKIFIPFFTTKKKGTGVGLSLSKKIVNMHNGDISISSGKAGTIATISL